MIDDQEYVRSKWVRPTVEPHPYNEPQRQVSVNCGGRCTVIYGSSDAWAWSAAAEFTCQREEEIRLREEEIELIEDEADDARNHIAETRDVFKRILAREQATLAELKRGMK